MMASVTIIPFDCYRSAFSDDVAFRWQDFGKGIPIIGEESAVFQVFQFVVEPPECCAITTTENPGDSSPAATVKGFDEPKFSFFR